MNEATAETRTFLLAETHPEEVAAAKQRFEGFGYDDTVAFIAATLDRLIAEHGFSIVQAEGPG